MEKISHIIPPSTRQVWVTGETDKPRRVADPVPVAEEMTFPQSKSFSAPSLPNNVDVEKAGVENRFAKGERVDVRA